MKTKLLADGRVPSVKRRGAAWLRGLTLATAVLLSLTAVLAEILDDFSDPAKFGQVWTGSVLFGTGDQLVTNGQVRISVTPSGDHGFSGLSSVRTFTLREGRTLEFRADLVSSSGDGAVARLGFVLADVDAGYVFNLDQDTVSLLKRPNPFQLFLLGNGVPIDVTNVKLVVSMTGVQSNVRVQLRILDNEQPGRVVYATSDVWDTPNRDPMQNQTDDPPGNFHGRAGRFFLGVYHDNAAWLDPIVGIPRLGEAEVVFDNAEVLEYDSFWMAPPSTAVCMSWPENTAEEQIVVGAGSLASNALWTPWPEPIFKRHGERCMAALTTNAQQFFKLVPGTQFTDDFDLLKQPFATRNLWGQYYWESANANEFTWNTDSGSLRVRCPNSTGSGQVVVLPPGPDVRLRDFYASVDILDWGTGSNQRSVGIVARGFFNRDVPASSNGYIGELWLNYGSIGKAHLNIFANGDHHGPQFELEAGVKYRLVFTGTGGQLTLRLFKQDTMELAAAPWSLTGSLFSSGPVGLWVGNYGTAAYDFTLDNFFVTGTKP